MSGGFDHPGDRLSAYADGELAAGERAAVEAHLRECGSCAAALEELLAVDAAARELTVEAPAGYFEAFPARVRARLPARRRARIPTWTWAAAAAVLLAVLTPLTLTLRKDNVAPAAARPVAQEPAPARPPSADQALPQAPAASEEKAEATPASKRLQERDGAARRLERFGSGASGPPAPPPTAGSGATKAAAPTAAGAAAAEREYALRDERANAAEGTMAESIEVQRGDAAATAEAPPPPPAETLKRAAPARPAPSATVPAPATLGATAGARQAPAAAPDSMVTANGRDRARRGLTAGAVVSREALAEFDALGKRPPASADQARDLSRAWADFVRRHPQSPLADEARVRAVEAMTEAWRLSGDKRDAARARALATAYLARDDARQKERARARVQTLPD